ncbi:MAG: hypothetical protein M3Q75_06445 [Gemmatimonadota bacterium]|nr:hypothetical protein [Gemmatimonadota bacterium]
MIPTFDDPDILAANLSPTQCVAATFIPDPQGEYEFDGEQFRCAYFPAPINATSDQMQELAFEVRHGYRMEPYQRWIIEEAKFADA